MSKRAADSELNRDNWDDEVHVDSGGGRFEKADKSALATRKILTPRTSKTMKSGTIGLFKSFTGFSEYSGTSPSFKLPSSLSGSQNSTESNTGVNEKEKEYLDKLKTLNENLLDWISKHIKEDPHCILTPIFSDYDKHLKQLHKDFPEVDISNGPLNGSKDAEKVAPKMDFIEVATTAKKPCEEQGFSFSFGTTSSATITSTSSMASTNFGVFPSSTKPTFTFGLHPPSSGVTPFPSAFPSQGAKTTAPFTFKLNSDTASSVPNQQTEEEDDDNYVPPKPEVKEIKEEGSVFSTRCKLFYKLQNDWKERGLGNLFIKPTGNEKFQLLIRADTNLGNILLNILVTKDIPIKVQKNNLTFVCIPSPPLPVKSKENSDEEQKPVPMLIRVKTESAAMDLMKQIDLNRGVKEA